MKHNIQKALFPHLLLSTCIALSSCSSDSGFAGIEGTGDTATASGTVTGFGSVYVNGIHFNTDNATVEIDGVTANEDALDIGMVVTVEGSFDTDANEGVAQHITADRILEGEILSITPLDLTRKSLEIVGQTVFITDDAVFKNVTFDTLAEGMTVSVSGFISNEGSIAATYIARDEMPSSETKAEVEGRVSALNTNTDSFDLNNFAVNYSGASFIDGDINDLENGKRVEVKGDANYENKEIQATTIKFKNSRRARSGDRSNLEGVVYDVVQESHFYINDTKVDISDLTDYVDVVTEGSRVVVSGSHNNDTIKASSLYVKRQTSNRFNGMVEDINERRDQLTVFGTTFNVNRYTAFEDHGMAPNRYFNLRDIRVDESLEIFAYQKDGQWIATRIRRDSPVETPQQIWGKVSLIEDDAIYVMGIMVDTTNVDDEILDDIRIGMDVIINGQYMSMLSFLADDITIHEVHSCDDDVFFDCKRDDDKFFSSRSVSR